MQSMDQIRKCWSSGFVARWHTNTDPRLRNAQDTTDAHSNRVAKLVYMLGCMSNTVSDDEDLASAVECAVWHDAPEKLTGDVSYAVKRLHPEIRPMLAKLDEFYWGQVGVEPVNDTNQNPLVALCDQIDALLFCKLVAPDLWLRRDWQDHTAWTIGLASALGCAGHVEEIINGESVL